MPSRNTRLSTGASSGDSSALGSLGRGACSLETIRRRLGHTPRGVPRVLPSTAIADKTVHFRSPVTWWPWSSGSRPRNPPDAPSRVYAERHKRVVARARAVDEFQGRGEGMLHLPRELVNHVYVFVHLFSGPRRPGDLEEWVRRLAWEEGFDAAVISFDPLVSEKFDILSNTQYSMIRKLAYTGRIDGEHGGPVCATWSRLRHLPGGPPPLRSRRRPFGLPGLSARNGSRFAGGQSFS